MEEKRTKSLILTCMILGLFLVQSNADTFSDCYKGCFIICFISPGTTIFSCATKCIKDCIFPPSVNSLDDSKQTHSFCKFGCAASLCTNFSTKTDPAEKKVGSCVNSCSNRCSKNYKP